MNTTKVKILGHDYNVDFPNVGQHMEIESLKHAFTNGRYGEMVRAGVKSTDTNLDLVDAICTFSILVPAIKEKLGKTTLTTLDMKTGLELAKSYREQYLPWYNGLMKELYEEYDDLSKAKKDADKT